MDRKISTGGAGSRLESVRTECGTKRVMAVKVYSRQ